MTKENQKIIPLTSNTMFKEIFGRDENKEMTAYLISEYFELDYSFVLDNIIHQNTIQSINNLKDYSYDVDIILSLNNEVLINVEMNKHFWDGVENRNLSYFTKIFSSQYEKGKGKEQFRESKKCIQINFNNYNKPKNKERTIYRFRDIETNEELTDRIEIHHVNLEVIKNKCYNKPTEELREAREYGMKMAGLEEGIQKGIEQTKRQVVINMLNDNLNIDLISKYTDLTVEEISKIKLENNL